MMAEVSEQGEFWLPSEFLPEDFFHDEKARLVETKDVLVGVADGDAVCFPSEFPYDYDSSNLSSPVESMAETESDEDELYMTGLARQMAQTFLHHDDNNNHRLRPLPIFSSGNRHKMSMAGSPQSPLCSGRAWSKMPPKISSPPPLVRNAVDKDWEDMLLTAAGVGIRTRLEEEKEEQLHLHRKLILSHRGLLGTPLKPCLPPNTSSGTNVACHRNPSLSPYQLQQLQMLKQRQQSSVEWVNPQARERRGAGGTMVGSLNGNYSNNNGGSGFYGRSPHTNNGMRAVFLATPASRKQSCGGTGVFLPRSAGCPTELRTKPACSTVLLPARVVQALNLNLDEVGAHGRVPGGFILDQDTMIARNNSRWLSEKKVFRPQPPRMHANHHELRLPTEWTY